MSQKNQQKEQVRGKETNAISSWHQIREDIAHEAQRIPSRATPEDWL